MKPAPAAVSFREIYLPAFDGARGMIALSITLAHSMRAVGWWPNHEFPSALRSSWFFSIEFLFLLGGFVAFLPLLHFGRFSARSFAMRRAGRILPLYYVTLLAAVLLGSQLRAVTLVSDPHDLGAVLAHVVFLQHVVYPFESGFGVHGIVWTMTIVVCFWLLYPVIARPYARHPFIGLAVAIALMVAWRLAFSGESRIGLQFPLFAADFAIGMTAAWCYLRLRPRLRERPRPGLALGIGGAALLCMWTLLYLAGSAVLRKDYGYWGEGPVLAVLVPAAFGIALICLPFVPRAVQRVFDNRPAALHRGHQLRALPVPLPRDLGHARARGHPPQRQPVLVVRVDGNRPAGHDRARLARDQPRRATGPRACQAAGGPPPHRCARCAFGSGRRGLERATPLGGGRAGGHELGRSDRQVVPEGPVHECLCPHRAHGASSRRGGTRGTNRWACSIQRNFHSCASVKSP